MATAAAKSSDSSDTKPQADPVEVEAPEKGVDSLVDMDTFEQLLDMDDDAEHSFSKGLVWDYFSQASTTFEEMDAAVKAKDLLTLSRKGHFLKGSSAALGLNKVKASCEKMQNYGNKKKADGEGALPEDEAMDKCKDTLEQLKIEQDQSVTWLKKFYEKKQA